MLVQSRQGPVRTHTVRIVDAAPAVTAGTLALVAIVLGWRGADWPAQLLRYELVERHGAMVWNNLWFAGHHTVGYGIVFPVLAAAVGVAVVAVASCVVAAGSFRALAVGPARWRVTAASLAFAAGTVVNVAVGRLTFALGLAIGMAALAALRRHHDRLACLLVLLTAPASPVAGVMLALALASWAKCTRRPRLVVLAALAIAPVVAATLWFPQGGRFPFRAGALGWSLCVAAVLALVTTARVVRVGAVFYTLACVATFIVPNPLGANATRLGMFLGAPLLVLTARRPRSPVVVIALPAIVWWQWSPAIDGITRAGLDPSSTAAYHEPLVSAVRSLGGEVGRIEVVPTQRHWETVYVATDLPLARGWERQLDMGRNDALYGASLDADTYHRWLLDNAVRFVALADVAVDPSAQLEAALVHDGLPFLEPVWQDEHWRLWRVIDAEPIVSGPARLVRLDPTTVVLDVATDDPVLVRVRYTSHFSLDRPGCVLPGPDGWTVVDVELPGVVTMSAVLARSLPVIGPLDDCAPHVDDGASS
jgi:hypothetical protein